MVEAKTFFDGCVSGSAVQPSFRYVEDPVGHMTSLYKI